jgi:hypothetical protein
MKHGIMQLTDAFLKALAASADRSSAPLRTIWPVPGNPVGLVSFSTFDQWREFVSQLSLRRSVPDIVRLKFERGQKQHLLAWLDFDLIKAGELVTLTTLELALTDRYGHKVKVKNGRIHFSRLLRHMPGHDGFSSVAVEQSWRFSPAMRRRRKPKFATSWRMAIPSMEILGVACSRLSAT